MFFYQSTIQSVFTYSITAWYAGSSAGDKKSLQRFLNLAQKIIGCPLRSLEEISSTQCLKRVGSIMSDSSHPAHHILELLPSGRCFRSIKTRTSRLRDSFFPWAIRTLNNPTINYLFIYLFMVVLIILTLILVTYYEMTYGIFNVVLCVF